MTRRPGVCMGCLGAGRDQPRDRRGQRLHRRRAAGRHRRLEPARVPRHGGVPGDRPGRRVQADHEVGASASTTPSAFPSSSRPRSARRPPGGPGPVYLDMPGDVLGEKVEEDEHRLPAGRGGRAPRTLGRSRRGHARRSRSWPRPSARWSSRAAGCWWSDGAAALQAFVEATGIPFYTTPISRGIVPEDHALAFLNARSKAFTEADVVLVVGTRFNWVIQFGRPPRFAADLKVIHVDINPTQLGHNRAVDVPIARRRARRARAAPRRGEGQDRSQALRRVGGQAPRARRREGRRAGQGHVQRRRRPSIRSGSARRCATSCGATRILVVDGQEILNFGRQAIPTFVPGHRLNSGAFGCMGVGLPFGVGAKVAKPDAQVLVLHGDGSYGINAMEIDTAVRHKIPVLVVISNNGGWTADAPWTRPLPKPGRNLGYTRYDKVAQDLGRARRVRREAARYPAGAGAGGRLGQAGGGQRHHRLQGAGADGALLRVHHLGGPAPRCRRRSTGSACWTSRSTRRGRAARRCWRGSGADVIKIEPPAGEPGRTALSDKRGRGRVVLPAC